MPINLNDFAQNISRWLKGLIPSGLRPLTFALMLIVAMSPDVVQGQDGDDDFYDDEYVEDDYDSDGYFEDEYYEDEYSDDEYGDDDFADEDYFDDDEFSDDYDDGEFYDDEFSDEFSDDDFSDEDFSDEEFDAFDAASDEGLDLADDGAGEVELAEIVAKKIKELRIPWGYTARLSISSPWLVGMGFDEWWYSFIDGRLTLEFPTKTISGQSLTYSAEISTYSFEHTHPSGGQFQGVALLGVAKFPWGPLKLSAGAGLYGFSILSGGMIFGAEYKIPFIKFFDISVGSRLNYVMKSTTATGGAVYWVDATGSLGIAF